MKSRLLVAAIGVPVLLCVIFLAPMWVIALALSILSAIGAWELCKCVGAPRLVESFALVGSIWAVFGSWLQVSQTELFLLAFVIALFAYAVIKAGEVKFAHIGAALFGMFAIPYAFSAFLRISEAGFDRAYLLLPFLFSFASDTGGYFAGRAFGKHKLAPKVSPKKTVEGSIGGIAGNIIVGVIFALVMNNACGESISYVGIVVLAVFCSIVAQLGDLSFSLIKREFGIKDYGRLFLEHGGVLDRFDSVLFVAPVLSILLSFMC